MELERLRHSKTSSGQHLHDVTASTTSLRCNNDEANDTSFSSTSLVGGPLPPYAEAFRQPPIGWWSLHSAWSMYLFLSLSVGFAVGHHMYYKSHHGAPAVEQTTTLRYGTALAFCTKTCLIWAVAIAWRQRAYTVINQKPLSLRGLDCLFATTDDPTALVNRELFRHAKVVVFMASCCWIGPLMVILASQASSVEPKVDITTCPGAKTLNLFREGTENWRNRTIVNRHLLQSMSVWNATRIDPLAEGYFDYWTGVSATSQAISESAFLLSQSVVGRVPSYVEPENSPCGLDWSCEYDINFLAPGYKCTELAKGANGHPEMFDAQEAPIEFESLLPLGNWSYAVSATRGDYSREQISPVSPGGMPTLHDHPFPKNLGAFRTEPIIWVGFAKSRANESAESLPANSTEPGWSEAFEASILACKMYETSYTVHVTYSDGLHSAHVLDREYLWPAINTTFVPSREADDGTNDTTFAAPNENYVFPQDLQRYRIAGAYYSLGSVFRQRLNGTMDHRSTNSPIANSLAMTTNLLDNTRKYLPHRDLPQRLTSLFEFLVLSILTNPQMLAVTWAGAPNISAGPVAQPPEFVGDKRLGYPCIKTRPELRFRYDVRDLWLVYGASLFLAIGVVAVGNWSVLENGRVLQNTRYSTVHTLLQQLGIRYEALG